MKNHNLITYGRLFFGTLGVVAIIAQLIDSLHNHRDIVNFFSFFTVESNVLAAIILLTVGIGTLTKKQSNPQFAFIRGAMTLYMTMTGIIYVLLLSGNEVALQTTIPWVNLVLHYLLPVIVLLDWLIFPPKFHLPIQKTILWVTFPLVYLVYSLIRGASTEWYPYPFIDPISSGWPTVFVVSLLISIGVTGMALLLSLRTPRKVTTRT